MSVCVVGEQFSVDCVCVYATCVSVPVWVHVSVCSWWVVQCCLWSCRGRQGLWYMCFTSLLVFMSVCSMWVVQCCLRLCRGRLCLWYMCFTNLLVFMSVCSWWVAQCCLWLCRGSLLCVCATRVSLYQFACVHLTVSIVGHVSQLACDWCKLFSLLYLHLLCNAVHNYVCFWQMPDESWKSLVWVLCFTALVRTHSAICLYRV